MGRPDYNPKKHSLMTFHNNLSNFYDGSDTPRKFLERCLEKIDAIEEEVMAWEIINIDAAREAADQASKRYN